MIQSVAPTQPLVDDDPASPEISALPGQTVAASPRVRRRVSRWGVTLAAAGVLVGLVVWLLTRAGPLAADAQPTTEAGDAGATVAGQAGALRLVRVATPGHDATSVLTLPANVDAYQTTLLYSRVSGYLSKWYCDIGDAVTKGQPLAEIDTPEMDQELGQAKAGLVQGRADLAMANAELLESQAKLVQGEADTARAQANLEFAHSVLKRNEQLSESRVISAQDLDENRRDAGVRAAELDSARASIKTDEAMVATARAKIDSRQATVSNLEANVRRLEELQEFKTIRAPFDGVLIRRRAEVGMLVAAGGASSSQELFAVAQTDRLRIRVHVPQAQANAVAVGQQARLLVPELPDQPLTAAVTRTAQAVDPGSRTLIVELELASADHRLLPGTYAQVALPLPTPDNLCTVRAGVLMNRPDGLKVGVLDAHNVVRLRSVKLGRDFGSSVEVISGLTGDERLVFNPPDDLLDGEQVAVADREQGTGDRE